MRVLIVDDEAPARRKLRRLLEGATDVEIVGEAGDGLAAVEALRRLRPDVAFLDVRMPGLDGFEVVHEVGVARMPRVVFVTAFDQYAVQAFEVQALDYLLKPVAPSRFEALLERLRRDLQRERSEAVSGRLEALLQQVAPRPRYLERLLVENGGRGHLLALAQVDLIEAARNYVCLTAGGVTYTLRSTLGALAGRLDPRHFLQLNRSQIVRLDAVRELQPWFHGDCKVLLKDGRELMWSRRYRAERAADFSLG